MSPLPSITQASAGIVTSLPTARMTPRATTTVASSIGDPDTGTTFAPRIAKYCGSPPCPKAGELAHKTATPARIARTANKPMRPETESMPTPSWKDKIADPPPAARTDEATGKFSVSQADSGAELRENIRTSQPELWLLLAKEARERIHRVCRRLAASFAHVGQRPARASQLRFQHARGNAA